VKQYEFVEAHVAQISRNARIAFAAELGSRVQLIYLGRGDFCFEEITRAGELAWAAACGEAVDGAEVEQHQEVLDKLVETYAREEIKDCWATLFVIQHALKSLDPDEAVSRRAVEQAAAFEPDVAQDAPFVTYEDDDLADRHADLAAEEEKVWQRNALTMLRGWQGVARRDMFDSIEPRNPRWREEWKQATDSLMGP
jgi:hypothetical protein